MNRRRFGLLFCLSLAKISESCMVAMKFTSRFFLTTYFCALCISVGFSDPPVSIENGPFPECKNNVVHGSISVIMEIVVTTFLVFQEE